MTILAKIIEVLKKQGELIVIDEEVNPDLEMAAIQLLAYGAGAPAIYFPKIKGSKYPAVSNLFGTMERSKFIFRKQWDLVQKAIALRNHPMKALKTPFGYAKTGLAAINALPKKVGWNARLFDEIRISDLPQIKHWAMDGGAFITLPQVFSQYPGSTAITDSNLGMYRIQLSGNDYVQNDEVGLHYQIHRGIGIHHQRAVAAGQPLKVSVFVGGHPAHTLSAVMPLPEGLSELVFAGMLAGRRFRYAFDPLGHVVSVDADFVITGEIDPEHLKPEGPFGDHLGYYSLAHPFPVMKVSKVYARKGAVWPFTVVGRPPQEDTSFGALIHELTGSAIRKELPGVHEVHAVDAAGVHPLLLALGSERYTPYAETLQPAELLTQAHHILGTGQLSLAKFLWITGAEGDLSPDINDISGFFTFMLERIDWRRDVHFFTETTVDTLDYTGQKLNQGSKVVIAAYGKPIRNLGKSVPIELKNIGAEYVQQGVLAFTLPPFSSAENAEREIFEFGEKIEALKANLVEKFPLIIICDKAEELTDNLDNFLWQTFTRADPAQDIHGVRSFIQKKHWGCEGSLIIDARTKPYMPPALKMDKELEEKAAAILGRYWPGFVADSQR